MIGVIADSSEEAVVREFFELFKTPWEFCHGNRHYDVVVCTNDNRFDGNPRLLLRYAGRNTAFDGGHQIQVDQQASQSRFLLCRGNKIPVYGEIATFDGNVTELLTDECSQRCVGFAVRSGESLLVRIGYDLFDEVRRLLTTGQPAVNAGVPALELHISLLRDLIIECGVPLVEIPPLPEGYRLIACLTHDVDHPSIRLHKWDHTMFGFLYRALWNSVQNFMRGRLSFQDLLTNWRAASTLPFVFLGLAKDPWRDFAQSYLEVEKDLSSTFFVIAIKNDPGRNSRGQAPNFRASRYHAPDIADTIHELIASGHEIGLHGIDAWIESTKAREELNEIRSLTGASEIGVRMHWLYYDQQSPLALEQAGISYDSTVGYNETVGYRSGTTQAYKPLHTTRLLELPLHVMDTALFYPVHLGLCSQQAALHLEQMMDNAIRFGGCLTINWHDRSLSPERLWRKSYCDLVQSLKIRGAWFSTAGQAVAWFRKRRSAVFETDSAEADGISVKARSDADNLPGLRVRIYNPPQSLRTSDAAENYIDMPFEENMATLSGMGAVYE
jgi:peptidoglycan/xylan/chitin deacetylase (PgdA/CDA1 family)